MRISVITGLIGTLAPLSLVDARPQANDQSGNKPTCRTFVHDTNRTTWNLDAYMATKSVSHVRDCSTSTIECNITTEGIPDFKFTWSVYFDHPDEIQLDLGGYDAAQAIGFGTNELTVEKDNNIPSLRVPPGEQAYIAVTPHAAVVPGVYQNCTNDQVYNGKVLLPSTETEYHLVRTNGQLSQTDAESASESDAESASEKQLLPRTAIIVMAATVGCGAAFI
jgi:hypothetical protein